ncbi:probable galacturonosyltransferase 7 isoform X1 [Tanacetum coccineum]
MYQGACKLLLGTCGFEKQKTNYILVFSDWHYALPKIFPTLKKIVVLDDDIVVQRDLSELWSIDMGGKSGPGCNGVFGR